MNPHKFSAIAHRDHDYCNPIAAAKIERILDLLPLGRDANALDLGCGRGELSLRIVERFQARVTAVDTSSPMLDAARERARTCGALERLRLLEIDIAEFNPEPESFDLTVMLGGGGIAGGIAGICTTLAAWTRRGGYILIGEGYWARPTAPEYLAHLEAKETEFRDHRGNARMGNDAAAKYSAGRGSAGTVDALGRRRRGLHRHVRDRPREHDAASRARVARDAAAWLLAWREPDPGRA